MAAPYNPPKKNEDFLVRVALEDMANPGSFKASPTIAAGDFKVSIDGGALANLATLPSVSRTGHRPDRPEGVGGLRPLHSDHTVGP